MPQRVFHGYLFQLRSTASAEGTSGAGQQNLFDSFIPLSVQGLKDCGVLGIDREKYIDLLIDALRTYDGREVPV